MRTAAACVPATPRRRALQLFRPSPAPAPADALLRSAAEAAAINRSAEAQHIKRSWDALVGASPLPATVRHVFSPAATQPQLAAFRSPAVPAPFLFRPYSQPAPGLPGRLPYALGASAAAGEPLPAPAALYRSAVQQQRQQHYSHQGLPQQPFIAQQQQQQAAGGEVEASKFTRVVHSHSPSYQAVVSSTVEVVRQSAAPLSGAPQLHFAQPAAHYAAFGAAAGVPPPLGDSGAGRSGVTLEELPPGWGVAGAQGRSAQQQQQQDQQQPPERPSLPMQLLPQQPLVVLQVPLMEQPLGPAQPPEPASQPQLSPPSGEAQGSLSRLPGTASLEQAMGVVGNLVRDLCSPTPETPGDLGGDQQQSGQLPPFELAAPSSEGADRRLGAEAAGHAVPGPGSPPGQAGADGAAAPADTQPGVDTAGLVQSEEGADMHQQQQQQQPPAAPEPPDSAATGAGGAEGPVGEKWEAAGSPAPASQSQPSSSKGGSKGPKKRAGVDATAECTGKR